MALTASASAQDNKTAESLPVEESSEKTSYIYDLKKLVDQSKDNIKRVNEKIKEQAIYKRNLQREEKAREYYDRAQRLFEEGKVNEARDLWEKSIRITEHPEMKHYIKESEKRFKLQEQAMRKEETERLGLLAVDDKQREEQIRQAYDTAVTLYKSKSFLAAKEEFLLVEQLSPDYKATKSYLNLLEQDIARQEKAELKNQKIEIQRQQEEMEVARLREKEMWRKEIELKEQERRRKLTGQAQTVYDQAMELYRKKDFVGAQEKFQEVEWVIPDFKSTRKYLDRIEEDVKKQEAKFVLQEEKNRIRREWEDELARRKAEAEQKKQFEQKSRDEKKENARQAETIYASAVQLMEDKKYIEARDKFVEVQKIYPAYKATDAYIARLDKSSKVKDAEPGQVTDEVKVLYHKATRLYKNKDYAAAKINFEQVEFMYPNYRATRRYLSNMGEDKHSFVDSGQVKMSVDPQKDASDSSSEKSGETPVEKSRVNEEYSVLVLRAEPEYEKALAFYEEKKYEEAFKQFQLVETTLPNYKSTRPYLKRVEQQIKRIEQQRYKEEQIQQAETINLLAKQASALYQKILQLADDQSTSLAKKKFAMVDKLFTNMSKEQAKLLAEIAEEEEKLRLAEIAFEQEVQKTEFMNAIEPLYQEAVRLYQEKRYDEAKNKFLEAHSKIADYRSSKRYLALIEKQNQLLQQTIKDREEQIIAYQQKADEQAQTQAQKEAQAKHEAAIRDLVLQANSINEDIVNLSKDRNFEAIKLKFIELEKVVDNLLAIKSVSLKDNKEPDAQRSPGKRTEKSESRRKIKDKQPAQDDHAVSDLDEKRRLQAQKSNEIIQLKQTEKQDKELYRSAMRDFYAKNYKEAKEKFIQLEKRPKYTAFARKYLKETEKAIAQPYKENVKKEKSAKTDGVKARSKKEQKSRESQEQSPNISLPQLDKAIVPRKQKSKTTQTRSDYLDSLNLRTRVKPAQEISDQEQVNELKDVSVPLPVEPVKQPEQSEPSLLETPREEIIENKEVLDAAKNENTSALKEPVDSDKDNTAVKQESWFKRWQEKRTAEREKKLLEQKAREEEQAKFLENEKQKEEEEEAARDREAKEKQQRTIIKKEQQEKEREARIAARKASKEAERKLRESSLASKSQKAREMKLRQLYQNELRNTSGRSVGFEQSAADLQALDVQRKKEDLQRQKKLLRLQREEDRKLLKEKERKISTMINQEPQWDGAPAQEIKKEEPIQAASPVSENSSDSKEDKVAENISAQSAVQSSQADNQAENIDDAKDLDSQKIQQEEGVSPNEKGSWFQRWRQKRLSDRRKKYLEQKVRDQQEQAKALENEEQAKEEELKLKEQKKEDEQKLKEQKDNEQRQKEQEKQLEKKEKEKQRLEKRAALKASKEAEKKARAEARAEKKKKARDMKLRESYQDESGDSQVSQGLDKSVSDLETLDAQKKKEDLQRQQKLLRFQREEELKILKEKERELSTLIAQEPLWDGSQASQESQAAASQDKSVDLAVEDPVPQASAPVAAPVDVIVEDEMTVDLNPELADVLQNKVMEVEQKSARKQFEDGLLELYQEAVNDFKNRKYEDARIKFSDIEDLSPKYKNVRAYIRRANKAIDQENSRRERVNEDEQGAMNNKSNDPVLKKYSLPSGIPDKTDTRSLPQIRPKTTKENSSLKLSPGSVE